MKHIPLQAGRDVVFSTFQRRRGFFRRSAPLHPNLPRAELIWLPHYLVRLDVESRKGPGCIGTWVESWSGAFAIFDMNELIEEGGEVEGEAFLPKLAESEAVSIARERLARAILFQRVRDKPAITGVRDVTLLLYPFWVYYYERRRGLIDIKLLDAVTGAKGGASTRAGVLEAFKKKHENSGD